MKFILSFLTLFLLGGAPTAFAHDTDMVHEEPGTLEKRTGEVSPGAIAIFSVAIVGAGGYFIWLKLKQGKEPPKNSSETTKQ